MKINRTTIYSNKHSQQFSEINLEKKGLLIKQQPASKFHHHNK